MNVSIGYIGRIIPHKHERKPITYTRVNIVYYNSISVRGVHKNDFLSYDNKIIPSVSSYTYKSLTRINCFRVPENSRLGGSESIFNYHFLIITTLKIYDYTAVSMI